MISGLNERAAKQLVEQCYLAYLCRALAHTCCRRANHPLKKNNKREEKGILFVFDARSMAETTHLGLANQGKQYRMASILVHADGV